MYVACNIQRILLYIVHVCGLYATYISTVRVRGLITGACGRYAICVMLWFEVGETHANCSILLYGFCLQSETPLSVQLALHVVR